MTKLGERIANLKLSRDVELKANEIYSTLPTKIMSSKRVNQVIHLIVSEAYKSLHIAYDPVALATKLRVNNPNAILKDAARLGYIPVLYHYTPKDRLIDGNYTRAIGIRDDHIPYICDIIDAAIERFPSLNERTPQSVAAGGVAFYAMINGYEFNEETFSNDIGLSHNIVKKLRTIIAQAQ